MTDQIMISKGDGVLKADEDLPVIITANSMKTETEGSNYLIVELKPEVEDRLVERITQSVGKGNEAIAALEVIRREAWIMVANSGWGNDRPARFASFIYGACVEVIGRDPNDHRPRE